MGIWHRSKARRDPTDDAMRSLETALGSPAAKAEWRDPLKELEEALATPEPADNTAVSYSLSQSADRMEHASRLLEQLLCVCELSADETASRFS